MTLAMALDNSFEIMNENEMYDVNGGWRKVSGLNAQKTILTMYAAGAALMIAGGRLVSLGTAVASTFFGAVVGLAKIALGTYMILNGLTNFVMADTASKILKERGSFEFDITTTLKGVLYHVR